MADYQHWKSLSKEDIKKWGVLTAKLISKKTGLKVEYDDSSYDEGCVDGDMGNMYHWFKVKGTDFDIIWNKGFKEGTGSFTYITDHGEFELGPQGVSIQKALTGMRKFTESLTEGNDSSYTVNQINQSKFEVLKNGVVTYTLEKKQSNWVCDCIGFKYRHKCKHIDLIRPFLPKRHPRATITEAIKDFLPKLKKITPRVEVVGSYRRGKADSKDIDILIDCSAADFKKIVTILESYQDYKPVMAGDNIIRGFINGIEMDINRLSENMNYYLALEYRTGPMEHNVAMRALAKKLGGSLSENELVVGGRNIRVKSEKDIYDALGVKYQDPDKRSPNLEFIPRKQSEVYLAYKNGKKLGSAPSRMYAREQNKKLRDLCKRVLPKLEKMLENYSFVGGALFSPKVSVRITVSEKEELVVAPPFEVIISDGTKVKCYRLELGIKPVVKVDGKRVLLTDTIVDSKGNQMLLFDFMVVELQKEIDKELKLPSHEVGKLLSIKLDVTGFPSVLIFNTVPYPVEGVK